MIVFSAAIFVVTRDNFQKDTHNSVQLDEQLSDDLYQKRDI